MSDEVTYEPTPKTFQEWQESMPADITEDAMWQMEVYRLAAFLGDLCWHDLIKIHRNPLTRALCDQLMRSSGSVAANIVEGYSRRSNREKAHFYEYALGSARESREWYLRARHVAGTNVMEHRIHLLTQIIRLLLVMIPRQRAKTLANPARFTKPPSSILLSPIPF